MGRVGGRKVIGKGIFKAQSQKQLSTVLPETKYPRLNI